MKNTTHYKNKAIGPIPIDWEVKKLKDVATIKGRIGYRGYTVNDIVEKASGAVTISPSNLSNGSLCLKDSTYISWDKYYESPEIMVQNNDILLVKTGSTYGKSCLVSNLNELATINPQIVIIKDISQDIRYLSYIVSDKFFQNQIAKIVVGGAIPTLSQEALLKFSILLPPLSEQQKIAEVLATWDKAIQETETIIKKLVDRNKGLANKLFEKNIWQVKKLIDLFERITDKNKEGNTTVTTISARHGFIRQEDFFNKTVASKDLSNYYLINKGDFCYNKSYSKDYDWGVVKRLNDFEKAVVTTLYICFRFKDESQNSDFWELYFENKILDKGLSKVAQEGGRAHGLLNVTSGDFFGIKVKVPSLEEQNAIAEILNKANQEVKQYQQKLEALKCQKIGLMQQLLTGKVRTV